MLGISGWKSRLCSLLFGLGIYLVASAIYSTRKFTHNFEIIHEGNAGSISSHDGGNTVLPPIQQFPQYSTNHHPRNLAAAVIYKQKSNLKHRNGPQIDWCHAPLGYKPAPGPTVALASFPGSGNTWLRYLLQQATGLLTGSVYKDYALLKNGFPAELVVNGSVLVVKTHEFGPNARKPFDRVVLLVRNPFASLQAEFNRRSGGHTGHASADKYKRNGGKYWKNFVNTKGEEWAKMNLDWFNAFPTPDKLVVFYEDLLAKPLEVLQQVLDFLGLQGMSNGTLQCVLDKKEGIYKRSKKKLGIEVFNNSMRAFLQQKQRHVYFILKNSTSTVMPNPPK